MPGWAAGRLVAFVSIRQVSSVPALFGVYGSRVDHPCTERSVHIILCTILAEYSG